MKRIQMDDRGIPVPFRDISRRPLRVRLCATARLVLGVKDERDGILWNLISRHPRSLTPGRDEHQPRSERNP